MRRVKVLELSKQDEKDLDAAIGVVMALWGSNSERFKRLEAIQLRYSTAIPEKVDA